MHRINLNVNKSSSLLHQSISHVKSLLDNGQTTASVLCNQCLARIKKTKSLNAFITVTHELAISQANDSDMRRKEGKTLGVLDGIPIAVKDNFCTKNIRTTCASKMLSKFVPPYDASVVEKLMRVNGATLMGKTNMDEYAMGSGCVDSIFGPTINPWKSNLPFKLKDNHSHEVLSQNNVNDSNDWYISGGSSGGSAVAVSSGACFASIGTDTGGSIRNPASRVGVVGVKPTYGSVSRYGVIPLTHSMDVPGVLARSVSDAAIILNAIAGHDPKDSTTSIVGLTERQLSEISLSDITFGIPNEYQCDGMSDEIIKLWESMIEKLASLGAKIKRVSLPHTKYSTSCYSILNCCEVASNFACYDGIEFGHRAELEKSVEELYAISRHEAFSETVRGRILAGNYFLLRENYEQYFNQALKVRRLIANDFEKVFDSNSKDKIDLLLTPVTLSEALLHSEWIKKDNRERVSIEDYCTQPVNMAGLPAISLPCKISQKGLPLSLQLIANHDKDMFMLSVARKLEQIVNFPLLVFENEEEV